MLTKIKKNANHLFTRNCGGYWSDGKFQPSVGFPGYRRDNLADKACAGHDHCMHYANTNFDRLQCDVAFANELTGQSLIGDAYVYMVTHYNPYLSQYKPKRVSSIPLSDRSDYPSDYSGPYIPNMPFYDPLPLDLNPGLRGTPVYDSGRSGDPGGRAFTPTIVPDKTLPYKPKRTTPTTKNEENREDYSKAVVIYKAQKSKNNDGPPQGDMQHVKSLTSLLNNKNARKRIKNKNKNDKKKSKKQETTTSFENDNGSGIHRKQHQRNQKFRKKP